MASGGPTSNVELYQEIFRTKDAARKQEMMKALSATQKQEYLKYLQLAKAALAVKETEAKIAALDEREAVLRSRDKSLLNQASSSYAPKAGSVHTGPVADSATRYGSKFNQ